MKPGKSLHHQFSVFPNALSLLSQIQQAAEQDDPYADDYLLRFEQKSIRVS